MAKLALNSESLLMHPTMLAALVSCIVLAIYQVLILI